VAASGFFSSVGLLDRPARAQRAGVRRLFAAFGLDALARKNALRMSYGEFRQVLLLRALVNDPRVLICDEPFDGLDAQAKAQFARALESAARNGTRLIVTTHHPGDLPRCMTHGLLLDRGRVICQGDLDRVRAHPRLRRLLAVA
jgi:ABC-type molybdenum transport system ATPase subunit/photorepair protein PhrA